MLCCQIYLILGYYLVAPLVVFTHPLWKPQNSPQMRKCILDAPKPHNKSGTLFPETIVFDKLETDAKNVT